jgi:hypothetical protein
MIKCLDVFDYHVFDLALTHISETGLSFRPKLRNLLFEPNIRIEGLALSIGLKE